MKPVLTLDAAQTVVKVDWDPGRFVKDCADACGIHASPDEVDVFRGLLYARWKQYCAINETRDPAKGDAFWRALTSEWLGKIHRDAGRGPELMAAGQPLLYNSSSPYFSLFEDTLPALDALDALGIRLAIVSNWDYSLHRILAMLGIQDRFELVLASLEEGVEKPDPKLFYIAMERLGVTSKETFHVGDNPIDDVQGAQNAGIRALLLDRAKTKSEGSTLHSLLAIPGMLGWT